MDGRLLLTILACCGVFVIAAGIAVINPASPGSAGMLALTILSVSAAMFIIIRLIMTARRKRRLRREPHLPAEPKGDRAGFFHKRPAILFVAFLVGKLALDSLVNGRRSIPVLLIISLHVLLTVSMGILYARWAYSEEYVPVLAALIVTIADATYHAFNYASDPAHQFRYGPEIFWFAAVRVSGRLMLIPIVSVIIWGSWRLSAPKGTINVTDPPALVGLE